ncbi:glycosyltransferase family 2 protein [bacterium]|nr:MAG: glycosyltransferase family 2 protein [bacterium]
MIERPDVTVIVPALNEEDTLREVIDRVLTIPLTVQLIVVDDGSTDSTPAILAAIADPRLLVLRNETRSGKGSAIRKALPFAEGIATIVQDADLEYSPEQIPLVVAPILHGDSKAVYGTRFHKGLPRDMALPNKVVNVLLALAVRVMFGHRLTDEATCYKAFRTELLQAMELECCRFEFCPEVTAKSLRMGERIMEVPIDYVPRSKKAGKKIRWTDAPEAFLTLWKHRRWEEKRAERVVESRS